MSLIANPKPLGLLILAGLFSFSPVVLLMLITATVARSMDAWRRSVHDTTLNLLYTRIKRSRRRFTISVNNGPIKPFSAVVAACLILFTTTHLYRPMFRTMFRTMIRTMFRPMFRTMFRTMLLVVLVIWLISACKPVRLVCSSQKPAKVVNLDYPEPLLSKLRPRILSPNPGCKQP